MSIPPSWREAYRAQRDLGALLAADVARHLKQAPPGWYTEYRVKEEQSFYQKIETGAVPDFARLEDFVGALIVVPLTSDLPAAFDFVSEFFEVQYRRPEKDNWAEGPASDFRFNDVRLYGALKSDEALPPREVDQMVFEIQVKTFFQHAWASATHDLVYKYPRFSWSRSRVAAQVRAILESAEMSIAALDAIEESAVVSRQGDPEASLNGFLEVIEDNWSSADLPTNRKRMTETISTLCGALGLDALSLSELLRRGKEDLNGHPEGWSPYQCVVDYASRYQGDALRKSLRKTLRRPKVIHVTPEVLERLSLTIAGCPSARI